MPLPNPRDSESEDDFIKRCMSNDLMNEEYPDNDQRYAICQEQWRSRNKATHPHGEHVCVCPECGTEITVAEDVKCNTQKCPDCGTRMRAKDIGERRKSMDIERKTIQLQLKEDKEGSFKARIATLNVIDKDGDVTLPGAFPDGITVLVSAYQHGSWMGELPVGKAVINESGEDVIAEGEFNLKTQAGKDHYESVKFSGGLQEWSYGFKVDESEEEDRDGQKVRLLKKLTPYEISPVLLGSGIETETLAIKSEAKGVIPYKETPKAPEDETWDAGKEVKEADIDDLKVMSAWYDSKNADTKDAYKLPHHKASGSHSVVWKGVAAAMGALRGARGGVAIPAGDKKGVYNHLVKHYKQFDKEPPEFRALDDGLTYADQAETALAAVDDLVTRTKSLADLRREDGRDLSDTNRERIKELQESLSTVAKELSDLLAATEPVDTEKLAQATLLLTKIKRTLSEVN